MSYPTLEDATVLRPRHSEAVIATGLEGVVLAEACPVNGPGTCLQWALTIAGQSMADDTGPRQALSADEVDIVLAIALVDDFAVCA